MTKAGPWGGSERPACSVSLKGVWILIRRLLSIDLLLAVLCVCVAAAGGKEIRVPAGSSIQEAIDAAPDGATIRIDPANTRKS